MRRADVQPRKTNGHALDGITARERVEAALLRAGSKRKGRLWQCPAHDDSTPSLHLTDGAEGLLVKCHAGCDTKSVVLALGLTTADLFDRDREQIGAAPRRLERNESPPAVEILGPVSSAQVAAFRRSRRLTRAESLEALGVVRVRVWESEWIGIPSLAGGWKVWALDSNGRPRLGDDARMARKNVGQVSIVLSQDLRRDGAGPVARLYDFEGESDLLAAVDAGLLAAFCGTGGAASLAGHERHREALLALEPAEVVVVRDLDAAGRDGAAKASAWWQALGVAVRVLELPQELGDGGDVRDYLLGRPARDGQPECEPLGGVADLEALADATRLISPETYEINEESPSGDLFSFNAYPSVEKSWPAPMGEAAYHGPLGELVRVIAPESEADPVALLTQAQALFGVLAGRNRYAEVGATRHYANKFVLNIGTTGGGRKGTAYDAVRAGLETAHPGIGDRTANGLSSGEGLVALVADDAGIADKRFCIVETEFSGPLLQTKRDGNVLSQILRQCWDRGELRVMTRKDPLQASGAHIGIIGHTTMADLLAYLDKRHIANGFGNRFECYSVRKSKELPDGGRITMPAKLTAQFRAAFDFAAKPGRVERDAAAAERWRSVYGTLTAEVPGLVGEMSARAAPIVLRTSLIYALADCSPVIKLVHLEAALACWKYAADSLKCIFGNSLGDETADTIAEELERAPGGLTRDDIHNLFQRNKKRSEIANALRLLENYDRAHMLRERNTGGRPAERWRAGPSPAAAPPPARPVPSPAPEDHEAPTDALEHDAPLLEESGPGALEEEL